MKPEIGSEIPPLEKRIYQRALDETRFVEDSIHNDAYTRSRGYRGAFVSAYVLNGHISQLLHAYFGDRWFTAGRYAVKYINGGATQGDRVTCRAVIREVRDDRVHLDVWMEREDGTQVVVGEASGPVPDTGNTK